MTELQAEQSPGDHALDQKIDSLRAVLNEIGQVAVAFSGGADSAFLAWFAHRELGSDQAHAMTAVSASLASDEERDCRALADEWGLRWTPFATDELANAAYQLNDIDRCYHCKAELMAVIGPAALAARATVVLGVNLDDLGDHRPGQQAALESGARFPLVEAGFTKCDVREASLHFGLRTWDKPAAACLASRVPYGTPVTFKTLTVLDRAESALHRLGFRQLRVRHYGDLARIEVEVAHLREIIERRTEVIEAVKKAGYRYVTVDLEGFRSGNLNDSHLGR